MKTETNTSNQFVSTRLRNAFDRIDINTLEGIEDCNHLILKAKIWGLNDLAEEMQIDLDFELNEKI